jgi:hypothetical protein
VRGVQGEGDEGTLVKERPILFSAPMVRAILAGTKTQTRRIVRIDDRPITASDVEKLKRQRGIPSNAKNVRMLGYLKCDAPPGSATVSSRVDCPYGIPGDRLWVRESIKVVARADEDGLDHDLAVFVADESATVLDTWVWNREVLPGIFMPRWACRIELEVTNVRVERLQEITEDDARAEGVDRDTEPCDHTRLSCEEIGCMGPTYRSTFCELWDSINGDRGGWELNPWVWVVEFRRVELEWSAERSG